VVHDTPRPGSVGAHAPLTIKHHARSQRNSTPRKRLPTLRKGDQGKFVLWLQVILNQRNAAQPALKQDGIFGPKTLASVIDFQRSSSLFPDGVVGLQTWMAAVMPEPRPVIVSTPEHPGPPSSTPIQAPADLGVSDWPLSKRFEVVLSKVPEHLGPELASQFRAMLTPTNIGILVASLTAWAVSHAFGVGEVVDLILLAAGAVFMGLGVFRAGEDIGDCLMTTLHAEKNSDLDRAADSLAQAVVILGIVTFFALLAKVGAKLAKSGGAAEGDAAAAADADADPAASSPKSSAADDPEPAPKPSVASEVEGTTFRGAKLRVRPGADDKVAVIGRNMKNVVEPYAEGPGAKYDVETFSDDKISPQAVQQWNDLKNYYGGRIPEEEVPNTEMFKENQAWAQKLKDQGYTVIDADNPDGQGPSPFYEMEKQILFGDPPPGGN
jgi:hypothetical protein